MDITVLIILLVSLVVFAVVCAMVRSLVKAAIALAFMSAVLSAVMFLLKAPLAAAFELSVCAGLITVVFISGISMTRVHDKETLAEKQRKRRKRFYPLPAVVVGVLAVLLALLLPRLTELIPIASVTQSQTVREVLWDKRQADIVGQAAIILLGVFGVLVFFKEEDGEDEAE